MQQWQCAYTYGGMMFAALRGNANARDFIAAWMKSLDRIANNTLLKGNSANAYQYHYYLGRTMPVSDPAKRQLGWRQRRRRANAR